MERYELPEGWEWKCLADVSPINTISIQPQNYPNRFFNYIALENIESGTGQLINFKPVRGDTIKSNKFSFGTQHVLLGKLRPYLNKVFVPDFEGICSTDVLPLLPDSKCLNRNFLAICLRSPDFTEYSTIRMEGTKMPRLRTSDLKAFKIPVPALTEQHRIVARIEELTRRVEETRKLIKTAEAELATFTPALLAKAFRGEL